MEGLPCTRKKGCLFLIHRKECYGLVVALSPPEGVVEISPHVTCLFSILLVEKAGGWNIVTI